MKRAIVICLLLAACGRGQTFGEQIAEFNTPTHRCGMIGSVDTGERINGTPVYEVRCTAYWPREEKQTGAGAKTRGPA